MEKINYWKHGTTRREEPMRKSELRKLRQLNTTPGMITAMKSSKNYDGFARAQYLGGILKIAFFKRDWIEKGINTPVCETFVNVQGKEWISRIKDKTGKEIKWTQAMFANLPIYPWGKNFWVTQDTFNTLKGKNNKYKRNRPLYSRCSWSDHKS